jgi:hypothetical protein
LYYKYRIYIFGRKFEIITNYWYEITNLSQERSSTERGPKEERLREKGPKKGCQREKLPEKESCGRI